MPNPKKVIHDRAAKEREFAVKQIRAMFQSPTHAELLQHILQKAKGLADYHTRIAQDGIGVTKESDDRVVTYTLKPSERVSYLDKASGIMEIVDYINRQIHAPAPEPEQKTEAE